MNKSTYSFLRLLGKIHLYTGLFVSPIVVLYALTAIMFNHRLGTDPDDYSVAGREENIPVTVDSSLDKLPLARDLMRQLDLHGEVDIVFINDKSISLPVSRPGETDMVTVDRESSTAGIEHRKTGIAGALLYLHARPGPHLVDVRGNWFWIRVWRWLVDITVYVLLVLTITGPAVWLAFKQRKRTGLIVAVSSFVLILALIIIMRG